MGLLYHIYIYIYISYYSIDISYFFFLFLLGSETSANPSDQFVHKPGPGIPTSSTPSIDISYHIILYHIIYNVIPTMGLAPPGIPTITIVIIITFTITTTFTITIKDRGRRQWAYYILLSIRMGL